MNRVMIIDDDPQIVQMLDQFLSLRGFEVTGFEQATDALKALAEVKVDAVLSDIIMPGMDGLEFLRELRRVAPQIPVLLITAFPKIEFVRKALEHGAVDFLPKPLNLVQLEQAIIRAIEQQESRERKQLSWKEKRLSKKIQRRMKEKEIRHLQAFEKLKWRFHDATEDLRRHPMFYILAVVVSAGLFWFIASSIQTATVAAQQAHSGFFQLMERAVNALEEDNRIDQKRPY